MPAPGQCELLSETYLLREELLPMEEGPPKGCRLLRIFLHLQLHVVDARERCRARSGATADMHVEHASAYASLTVVSGSFALISRVPSKLAI